MTATLVEMFRTKAKAKEAHISLSKYQLGIYR